MSLQGTLKTLGITEVLEFLSARSASGRLDVTTEMGTASYGIFEGMIASAEYSFIRESGVDAAEATYYVVSELDGTFFFDEDLAPADVEDTEDVGSLLGRTADIAESWTEVEAVIPSPNHLLIRNNQLDGSVTIQPEWWKALEMIGEGRTSLQLAAELNLGALDASLTALAMTNAGLLQVREIDPLDIDVDTSFGLEDDDQPLADDSMHSLETIDAEQDSSVVDAAEPPAVPEPVEALEFVEIEHPVPPSADYTFQTEDAGHTDDFVMAQPSEHAPEPMTMADMHQIVEDLAEPVADTPAVESAVVADDYYAGPSSMDDLSELEYVVEPDGFAPPVLDQPEVSAPLEAVPPAQDDDGWSTHAREEDLQPLTATAPAPVPEPASPSPFDVIDVPPVHDTQFVGEPVVPEPVVAEPEIADHIVAEAVAAEPVPAEPVFEEPPAMDLADLPAPPPPIGESIDAIADTPPVPETFAPTPTEFHPAADATTMAGEVLDDLAALTDALDSDEQPAENWTLDGTFVPDANPAPPEAEDDPFGALGDLLNDSTDDEERGSVLKFLRRD